MSSRRTGWEKGGNTRKKEAKRVGEWTERRRDEKKIKEERSKRKNEIERRRVENHE